MESYLNRRIVLTSKNEVCYAGIAKKILKIDETNGLFVEIDQSSGFAVWCPEDFIKEVIIIPIPEE